MMGERWESIRSAEKKECFVKEGSRDKCLMQRMKQTLSDGAWVRKLTVQEKFFSLLGYDLIAIRAKPGGGTELGVELKKHVDKAREKLGGDTEVERHVLSAWRLKVIDDIVHSGSKVHDRFKGVNGEKFYSKSAIAV